MRGQAFLILMLGLVGTVPLLSRTGNRVKIPADSYHRHSLRPSDQVSSCVERIKEGLSDDDADKRINRSHEKVLNISRSFSSWTVPLTNEATHGIMTSRTG
jgi:hypothetical protein